MNKPRQAKLVSCKRDPKPEFPDTPWRATDSAGRRFLAPTENEAVRMCNDYNARSKSGKEV